MYAFEKAAYTDAPGMHTLMLGATLHVEVEGDSRYTAHSCDPNCRLQFTRDDTEDGWDIDLVALRDIEPEELLSFDYSTAEYEMAAAFDCACGAAKCVGKVLGYKHLTREQQQALAPYISPYIASLQEQGAGGSEPGPGGGPGARGAGGLE